MRLTDHTSYADAQARFSRAALWDLVEGSRERLNIAHECVDRHPPERTAVRIAFADRRDEAYTFGEIAAWSSRFAHFLAREGVRAGERVAIFLEPSLPFYLALFGAMKAGAVAVPMFTLLGRDAVAARIDDCRPALALADAPLEGARTVVADDAFLESLSREPDEFEARTASSDMAMYQYTSGTTRALPEAVRHRHRAIVTVLIAALYATGVRPGDRFCCPSSPAWGHGLWHGTLGPLALGAEITAWSGRFDPERMLEVLESHRITNVSAAATHYRMMKNCGVAGAHRYKVEKLSFTGEPIDSDTAEFVERTFGRPARSMYGTTEVGVILGGYPGAADLPMKPGSLGKPMPGVEVAIRDAGGAIAATDAAGEIVVRRGDGWFPTKDLGRADEDGWFYHAGRADDVVISAGWTMSAVEIEDALLRHPDVSEIAVIGVPDELRGQVVKAFVVSGYRAGGGGFEAELQAFARERLGRHEYPRQVEFVAELPKTPAGKVNRMALREREAVRAGGAARGPAGAGAPTSRSGSRRGRGGGSSGAEGGRDSPSPAVPPSSVSRSDEAEGRGGSPPGTSREDDRSLQRAADVPRSDEGPRPGGEVRRTGCGDERRFRGISDAPGSDEGPGPTGDTRRTARDGPA